MSGFLSRRLTDQKGGRCEGRALAGSLRWLSRRQLESACDGGGFCRCTCEPPSAARPCDSASAGCLFPRIVRRATGVLRQSGRKAAEHGSPALALQRSASDMVGGSTLSGFGTPLQTPSVSTRALLPGTGALTASTTACWLEEKAKRVLVCRRGHQSDGSFQRHRERNGVLAKPHLDRVSHRSWVYSFFLL